MFFRFLFFALLLAVNSFAAEWYASGNGTEKCFGPENGILICREVYKDKENYCYGKERVWSGFTREKPMFDRNRRSGWFDKNLIFAGNLNYKCEYHGWARFRVKDGFWEWKCYLNNREAKDADCKGFTKR